MEQVRPDGLYGFQLDTVNSLILSLLPPVDFKFNSNREQSMVDPTEEIMLYVLRLLIQCLRSCSGLHIPFVCSTFTYVYIALYVIHSSIN